MNKVLFLMIVFNSFFCFSQKKPTINSQCLLATIQRDSVLVKLKEYSSAIKMQEAFQKQLQSEFDFKKLELDTKIKEYQEKEKTLTEDQKKEQVALIQKLDGELQKFSQEAKERLAAKERELMQPMDFKINKAIERVAAAFGYKQIIEKKICYYASADCDATQQVITEANK
jgi:outer membrane protein